MSGPLALLKIALALGPLLHARSLLLDRCFIRLFPRHYGLLWLAYGSWLLAVDQAPWACLGLGLLWSLRQVALPRSIPPGSLSLVLSLRALADPNFYNQQARQHGSTFKMAQFHQPVICLLGHERARRLFSQHRHELGPSALPFTRTLSKGFLRYMTPADHRQYGPLFRRALSGRVVQPWQNELRVLAEESLTNIAELDTPLLAGLDRYVVDSFLLVLYGLRKGTDGHQQFLQLYQNFARQSLTERPSQTTRSALRNLVSQTAGGSPSQPASAMDILREEEALDQVVLENFLYTMRTASDNVRDFLHWLVVCLAQNPQWIDRLASSPDLSRTSQTVIKETLRLHQSEYLYRRVSKTFEFEGYTYPQGWLVRICVAENHRNAGHFPDPEQFCPDRFLQASAIDHFAPFGMAEHACNGIAFTEAVAQALLGVLSGGYRLSTLNEGPPVRDFRHWSHWRPGVKIKVERRGARDLGLNRA